MKRIISRDALRALVQTWERRVAEAESDMRTKPPLARIGVLMQLWSARRILRQYQEIIATEDAEDAAKARRAGHEGPWVG